MLGLSGVLSPSTGFESRQNVLHTGNQLAKVTPVEQVVISRDLLQIGSMPSPTGDLRQILPARSPSSTGLTYLVDMTVSMRVMSAGDGYKYLLRTVAAADGDRALSTPLTRYYVEAGAPWGHKSSGV